MSSSNNCLLCYHCTNEADGSVDGYYVAPFYCCDVRELDDDHRFPYKNTKCEYYKNDESRISLYLKEVDKELFKQVDWKLY